MNALFQPQGAPTAEAGTDPRTPPESPSAAAGPSGRAEQSGHVAVDVAPPQAPVVPAQDAPRTDTAAQLATQLAGIGGSSSPEEQRAAFTAAQQYETGGNRTWDASKAVANQAFNIALTSAATFGVGRNLGNMAAQLTPFDPFPNIPVEVPATALGGTVFNMAAQAAVPGLVDFFAPNKMTAVPPEALVPQRGESLTPAEAALRKNIAEKQAALSNVGALANTTAGMLTFTTAQAARVMAEGLLNAPSGGPQAPPPGAGMPPPPPDAPTGTPGSDTLKQFAALGAGVAVSVGGGAAMGAVMGARLANASMKVPDPASASGELVEMKLFYPKPTEVSLRPVWAGGEKAPATFGDMAKSAGMRLLNLVVAAVPLQVMAATAKVAGGVAAGAAQIAGMTMGSGAYFQGLSQIASAEKSRAKERTDALPQPAGLPAGGAGDIQLAVIPPGAGTASAV